jgi:DNA polymerase III epsilon subunit-like protein
MATRREGGYNACMLVVDCEMTGLEPNEHSIVSVGAIDFDNPKRQLYEECRMWEGSKIEDAALMVNGFTREQVTDPSKQTEADLVHQFIQFAEPMADTTFAGQNVFTDLYFMRAAAIRAGHTAWPFAHRVIDIHSLCFEHMIARGLQPPIDKVRHHSALNLDAILNYCGIPSEPRPHNALTGAKCNAEVIARLLYGRKLLPEFAEFEIPWRK